MTQKQLSLLGSTGSIGQSALDVVRSNPDDFTIKVLVGGSNVAQLVQDALEFRPQVVALADESGASQLRDGLASSDCQLLFGPSGVLEACAVDNDICVSAITGFAGLAPTLTALAHTKRLALANKESLVCGGELLKAEAAKYKVPILPVDSEHSAIFQALAGNPAQALRRIQLTASGGPFRNWSAEDIAQARPQHALAHPNWDMGAKVTIDSASLMNKALEFIEALYLFDLEPDQIEVLVHPQSIVHSMVQYCDGSYLAQMGAPDMRTPIAYALSYPNRVPTAVAPVDWFQLGTLSFEPPRYQDFPLLAQAAVCWQRGSAAMIALNALNEEAVKAFLGGAFRFGGISQVVLAGLDSVQDLPITALADIQGWDKQVRSLAQRLILRYQNS